MNPHLETPLAWSGAAPEQAALAVLMLHGRGQTTAVLQHAIAEGAALEQVCFVAPTAAEQSWYPARFMAPREDNAPHLGWALERVETLSALLVARGVPFARQVLLGFSQGACLACEAVYRSRVRYGALLALTGGLIGPPDTQWTDDGADPARFAGMPALLGGSAEDPWVSAARMAQTAQVLRARGAQVELELTPGAEHTIHPTQRERARALLRSLASRSAS